MDVLLPDPLTFGFKLVRHDREHAEKLDVPIESSICIDKGSVLAHDMTPMEVLVRNNTKEMIKSLSITCRDVAGENCAKSVKTTVLWSAAAVIDDANDILRARARTDSPDEPIFCQGYPFHVRVNGTVYSVVEVR
ncbi:trafficking protein particle complex II-specific subunit 120 homolog isoform X2 [Tripterygium wilfordii]|uniref:trafficking protein particle complex II-specific subunit 120 homolog isoform X2 n=1 Tax=Tripterygium wilfordii TaxID=458696 RepID=UPI0018F80A9B|nr:trafficking protein particle complex II-specific subunit 120 homolog isoform X2 [Tripterygium wilfordii]